MKTSTLLTAVLITLATSVLAQSADEGRDIPFEEWRDMAAGRTLTYRLDGEFWALEHYHEGTNRVSLELRSGQCLEGTWEFVAPLYCYHWEDLGTSCFRHARTDHGIIIVEPETDADGSARIQQMTGISDVPLSCTPSVTS